MEPLPSDAPPASAAAQAGRPPAGNGVGALTGAQIVARARAALQRAGTVHLVGYWSVDGGTVAIDVRIKSTAGGAGFVEVNGNQIDLIRTGSVLYVHGSEAFWRGQGRPASVARQLAGRYMLNRPGGPLWRLAAFTDLQALIGYALQPVGLALKGHHKTIRGVDTIGVTSEGVAQTMYVALRGEPYPMQIVPRVKGEEYSLNLVDYGKPVRLAAPPPAQVVH